MTNEPCELTADQVAQIAALDDVLKHLDTVRADAAKNPKAFALADPWPLFIRKMRLLTPQSYGVRIQNYFAAHFAWETVPAKLDRGDVVEYERGYARYHEVKATLITSSNPGANFVQIRPHQDIAGYHLFVIEPDFTVVHLWLSKEQMAAELLLNGGSAHGTKAALELNTNREYAIRFTWTPTVQGSLAARWVEQYRYGPAA